ncbi:MAG: apolipoprotein N-acyltransferase, partial [Deltaproteobacteria bacterium]|nr:apolipoprotein N-acyltransferase [Deltaproteobacteria bacterium]
MSGILIALSFPNVFFGWKLPNLGFLAWFGLIPLILALQKSTPRRAFWLGFFTATIFFLIGYYWIYVALHDYGEISVVSSLLTTVLLASVMALYIGLACFLAVWFASKDKAGGLLLWLPIFWTLTEFARTYIPFGGFPWAHLAISQSNYTPLIQIADLTGYYGVVFLLVWFNVWAAESLKKFSRPKTMVTAVLLLLVLSYGFYKNYAVRQAVAGAPTLKVGLIQPNISQTEKWVEAFLSKHRKVFETMAAGLQANVDLIIWPETGWFETLWVGAQKINPEKIGVTLQREEGKPFTLLGLSFSTLKEHRERYYNSAALIDADGRIWGKYHKVRLVPFGEYVPFKNALSFLKPVAAIGDFERGDGWTPLTLGYWKIAPLI